MTTLKMTTSRTFTLDFPHPETVTWYGSRYTGEQATITDMTWVVWGEHSTSPDQVRVYADVQRRGGGPVAKGRTVHQIETATGDWLATYRDLAIRLTLERLT